MRSCTRTTPQAIVHMEYVRQRGTDQDLPLQEILADASNFGGRPHEFTHKCEVLQS